MREEGNHSRRNLSERGRRGGVQGWERRGSKWIFERVKKATAGSLEIRRGEEDFPWERLREVVTGKERHRKALNKEIRFGGREGQKGEEEKAPGDFPVY